MVGRTPLKFFVITAEEAVVAYIEERANGFLVVWRDAATGKKRSRLTSKWGYVEWNDDPTKPDHMMTKEEARKRAQGAAAEYSKRERAYRKPLERAIKENAETYPDGHPARMRMTEYIADGEEHARFENYIARLIDGGATTESAKATYRHTLKNHIVGTPLGRKNIGHIDAEDVESFWRALDIGDGAKRNVAQVLRKGFTRALRRGLIDVSPLARADIEVPSKKRRIRGPIEVLEPEDVQRLADAAALSSERDRIIVMVMAYAGLRAGEVGGLRKRDIVRRSGYCELRLQQQVVRIGREKKVTALKTEAAQRHVPVPCELADAIEAFLAEHPAAQDGRIIHGAHGALVAAQGINNAVQRAAERAQLGPVNSHLLRHTAASMWFDDGLDAESVRRALGHTDIKTTLGLYAHMMKGGAAKLAESMGRRMEAS